MKERKFAVVEKKFEYKGHECICVFGYLGFRCGYVSSKPKNEIKYYQIDCHGGLTFSGELSEIYEPNHKYYIGFDCGHYCDLQNFEQSYKYGLLTKEEFEFRNALDSSKFGIERTLEYVEEQCKKIVEQLEEQELNKDEI